MNRVNGLLRCWNKCVFVKLKLVIYFMVGLIKIVE